MIHSEPDGFKKGGLPFFFWVLRGGVGIEDIYPHSPDQVLRRSGKSPL